VVGKPLRKEQEMDMMEFFGLLASSGSTESNALADMLFAMSVFGVVGFLISIMGSAITHVPICKEKSVDRPETQEKEVKKAA
jgi:hypothetical protein